MTPSLKLTISQVASVDGIYVLTVREDPEVVIPLVVVNGVIHAMKKDQALSPEKFRDGALFTGPLWRFPRGGDKE